MMEIITVTEWVNRIRFQGFQMRDIISPGQYYGLHRHHGNHNPAVYDMINV